MSALVLSLGVGSAQERYNFLAIDGQAQPGTVGPYYFVKQGNSSDAFAKADLFAQALGVDLKFDGVAKQLVFSRGDASVTLRATGNVLQGLQTRAGTLQVNGEARNSPMGIIVEGSSYVPVDPLVNAFGGRSDFDAENLVLFVDTEKQAVQQATPTAAKVGTPRYGFQESSSRVALNLPTGASYHLLVAADRLVVQLDGLSADAFRQAVNDPFLEAFYFAEVGGSLALVVDTRYPLTPDGRGYRAALLPVSAERPDTEVLYIDFAPDLQSEAAAPLTETVTAEPVTPLTSETVAATKAPAAAKKTVVIDPGHGGKFAGAQGYVAEEDVVLQVALKLKALLERQGVTVLLTRDSNHELDPSYRADLSARGTLASPETNLFISVHANAVTSSSAKGIETWVFGEPIDDSFIALAIKENGGGDVGQAITQEALADARSVIGDIVRQGQLSYSLTLAEMVQEGMVESTGAKDRGVGQLSLQVLRQARTPAVLVEIGFVTNPDEGPKLGSDAYQGSLAQGLADGIMAFLNQGVSVASR